MRYIDAPSRLRLKIYSGPASQKALKEKDAMRVILKAKMDAIQVEIHEASERSKPKFKRRWNAAMAEWHDVCRVHRIHQSIVDKMAAA